MVFNSPVRGIMKIEGVKFGLGGVVYPQSYIDSLKPIMVSYFRYSGGCCKCDCMFDGMGVLDDIGVEFVDCPGCGYRNLL